MLSSFFKYTDLLIYSYMVGFSLYLIATIYLALKILIKKEVFVITSKILGLLSLMTLFIFLFLDSLHNYRISLFLFFISTYFNAIGALTATNGFIVLGGNYDEVYDAVIFGLKNLSIKYLELMGDIELEDFNNELIIKSESWLGVVKINLKRGKKPPFLKDLQNEVVTYLKANYIQPKKTFFIITIIVNLILLAFSAYVFYGVILPQK